LEKARTTLGEIDALVRPHFRYEEEALYPTLKQFLGEYVDSLVEEHDGAIGTARPPPPCWPSLPFLRKKPRPQPRRRGSYLFT
jgi:hypothetical protein